MTLLLIILAVLIIGFGVTFFLMKTGKIEDKDGNNIPDVIDAKIEETKEVVKEVKVKVKRVKEEAVDVVKAVKKVGNQVADVSKAVKGEPRKGRKPKQK
jgi:ABC-type Na+ efflux pump permease subunit